MSCVTPRTSKVPMVPSRRCILAVTTNCGATRGVPSAARATVGSAPMRPINSGADITIGFVHAISRQHHGNIFKAGVPRDAVQSCRDGQHHQQGKL